MPESAEVILVIWSFDIFRWFIGLVPVVLLVPAVCRDFSDRNEVAVVERLDGFLLGRAPTKLFSISSPYLDAKLENR